MAASSLNELSACLGRRPLMQEHGGLVSMLRDRQIEDGSTARGLTAAREVFRDAVEAIACGDLASWLRPLAVECARVLAEVAPACLLGCVAETLDTLSGLEQTAVLHAVARALVRCSGVHPASLRGALDRRWRTVLAAGDTVDNFPGVVAVLFEAMIRCGEPAEGLPAAVRVHPQHGRIIAMIALRPMGFLSGATRAEIYREALRALSDPRQPRSRERLSRLIARELPDQADELLAAAPSR